MKIERDSVRAPNRIYGRSEAQAHRVGAPEVPVSTPVDQVSLSEESRSASAARELLAAQPQVRAEFIQNLKSQIEQGAYSVHARNLADRLLQAKVFSE